MADTCRLCEDTNTVEIVTAWVDEGVLADTVVTDKCPDCLAKQIVKLREALGDLLGDGSGPPIHTAEKNARKLLSAKEPKP